jgi:histidinol dehydrogenase
MTATSLLRIISAGEIPPRRDASRETQTAIAAAKIVEDVRERGEKALREYAERLDGLMAGASMIHNSEELAAARDRLPMDQRELLERAAARIRVFAQAQRASFSDLTFPISGGNAGHTCIPVDIVGCYAPGGRFPLPSSVLMTAIPARVAGVARVWIASPRPAMVTLAAASIAGADGLLAVGGAQAIAALAFGLGPMPPCDMIVGPGNRWVTAAKQIVSDRVGIDMLAGPSELVVLADESADPLVVAADLLAQAEHDNDAVPILVTTSRGLAEGVNVELARQLATLPTATTALIALGNGFAVLADETRMAIDVCNKLAPEHLQVLMKDASAVAAQVRHCGGLFVGNRAGTVFGDYGAGPNHVLPTSGTARFSAGLSVFTFLRPRTWLRMDDAGDTTPLIADAARLARLEHLEGHARAAELRLSAGWRGESVT